MGEKLGVGGQGNEVAAEFTGVDCSPLLVFSLLALVGVLTLVAGLARDALGIEKLLMIEHLDDVDAPSLGYRIFIKHGGIEKLLVSAHLEDLGVLTLVAGLPNEGEGTEKSLMLAHLEKLDASTLVIGLGVSTLLILEVEVRVLADEET